MIPKVVHVILDKRPHGTQPWKMPNRCPACGSEVVHVSGEVAVRCPNRMCGEQRIRRFAHFASKKAMDIAHMGIRVIEQLVEKGMITTFSDIYDLTHDELAQLENFKEKSIHNLLTSIEKSKKTTLARFVFALGIKHVGEESAELLAEHAGDIVTLTKMKAEDFLAVDGIGEKTAQEIAAYFADPAHLKEIESLMHHGVQPEMQKVSGDKGHPFYGKTFVLTGTLQTFTRTQATVLIKERGGRVANSVTKETDYLLIGEEAGSKLDKAKKLGVELLDEPSFTAML